MAHRARLRGATSRLRSGAEAGRTPCPRGGAQEELPHIRGQGRQLGGATPCPRPGAAAKGARLRRHRNGQEELRHIQVAVAAWAQEGLEELSHIEGQEGGHEEIPLIQGKEQQLRFAGAAVKSYPTSKGRETQVRQ